MAHMAVSCRTYCSMACLVFSRAHLRTLCCRFIPRMLPKGSLSRMESLLSLILRSQVVCRSSVSLRKKGTYNQGCDRCFLIHRNAGSARARPPLSALSNCKLETVADLPCCRCKKVFDDRETFKVSYPADFILGWDDQKKHDDRAAILSKAFFEDGFEEHVTKFFRENVARLIKQSSLKYAGKRRSIDIVRTQVFSAHIRLFDKP